MLYLEDFLEMIENLPMEMRDRFTEMREMDLQVENAMDNLDEKVKVFFRKCETVPNLKQDWKDEQMAKILQEYRKTGEDADEKVQMANQSYELVERHLRKLDQEVAKFKMELEADNSGITEILERRAMEVEKPIPQLGIHKAEKRKFSSLVRPMAPDRFQSMEFGRESGGSYGLSTKSNSSATSSPATVMFESAQKPPAPVNYNLGQVGSGSNAAIAVAASRAIGATLEMQQGRRSASLKASYEAVSKNFDFTKDMSLSRQDLAAPSSSSKLQSASTKLPPVTAAESVITTPAKPSKKKSSSRSSASHLNQHHHHQQHHSQQQLQHQQQHTQQQQPSLQPLAALSTDLLGSLDALQEGGKVEGEGGAGVGGWQADPNEPRYCVCNDVSYGDMVACDNPDCPAEWFHYGCVGLQQAPRGKWYCPQCLTNMKRRGNKK